MENNKFDILIHGFDTLQCAYFMESRAKGIEKERGQVYFVGIITIKKWGTLRIFGKPGDIHKKVCAPSQHRASSHAVSSATGDR